jgi:hypothetical protein
MDASDEGPVGGGPNKKKKVPKKKQISAQLDEEEVGRIVKWPPRSHTDSVFDDPHMVRKII